MPPPSWFSSERPKNLAALLSSVAAAAAVVVSVTRPSASSSTQAYELLRKELEVQQDSIVALHRDVAQLSAWITVWREAEARRLDRLRDLERQEDALVADASQKSVHLMARRGGAAAHRIVDLPPTAGDEVPPPPPAPTPLPTSRPPLPLGDKLF